MRRGITGTSSTACGVHWRLEHFGVGVRWAALKDVDLLFPAMSPSCRRLISSRRHTRAEGRGHRERECVGETHKHTRGAGGGVTEKERERENVWAGWRRDSGRDRDESDGLGFQCVFRQGLGGQVSIIILLLHNYSWLIRSGCCFCRMGFF